MGNRVKGRPKKKSIKAALSSSVGSERKLSRMGKKQKKRHAGLEATFIGRSKCLKMLQVTLKDFRRLCILKGIYPRQPHGRVPGNKKGQSFYHIKDIKAIAHEPVLEKFREYRAFMKKVRRAAGRNEREEALRRNETVPTYTLNHLVKERYPRFQDALADIDDALTLTFLFAALPADRGIATKVTSKAKNLAAAWGAYCATTCSITKSFISVKGVYIESLIQSVPVRWVIPHSFTQHLPTDVDYRVMMTFFEFYETLLDFVIYKLYSDIGLRYPFSIKDLGREIVGSTSAILGANLQALTNVLQSSGSIRNVVAESVQKDAATKTNQTLPSVADEKTETKKLLENVDKALKSIASSGGDQEDVDEEEEVEVDVSGPLKVALDEIAQERNRAIVPGSKVELDDDALKRKRLFQGLTFYLSREVPRGYLELVCLAYGGKVGWDGEHSLVAVDDPAITHHIVDRPKLLSSYNKLPKSREFVQPQWILDCANFMFLLPVERYVVGSTLPPHLSPWVDDDEEGYKPAYAEEIEKLKNGETIDRDVEQSTAIVESAGAAADDGAKEATASSADGEQEEDVAKEQPEDDDQEPEQDDDDDDDHHDSDDNKRRKKQKLEKQREKEEKEAHELAKTMMSRKAANLYGKMQYGLARKQEKVDNLHRRRKEIGGSSSSGEKKGDAAASGGKTVLKQKVERLKKERKDIEATYDNTGGTTRKKRRSS
ncbi:hypothetical protein ACA910_012784 [Epithemia clementina (nom. ined.)]